MPKVPLSVESWITSGGPVSSGSPFERHCWRARSWKWQQRGRGRKPCVAFEVHLTWLLSPGAKEIELPVTRGYCSVCFIEHTHTHRLPAGCCSYQEMAACSDFRSCQLTCCPCCFIIPLPQKLALTKRVYRQEVGQGKTAVQRLYEHEVLCSRPEVEWFKSSFFPFSFLPSGCFSYSYYFTCCAWGEERLMGVVVQNI